MPTPAGVPVEMMSPGSRVNTVDRYSTCSQHEKIMSSVDASWRRSPLTQVRRRRRWGSPTSSAVTIHGPIGPWVSKDFPSVHVGVRHCQSRTVTSLRTVKPATTDGGVGGGHVPATAADDHGELALVVDLGRDPRDLDGVARPDHTGALLVEPDLVLGARRPGLGHVRGVVEPDAEHLDGVRHRRAQMDLVEGQSTGARALARRRRAPWRRARPRGSRSCHRGVPPTGR